MAILARNKFVPTPAVAQMPVFVKTASIKSCAIFFPELPYKFLYGVPSMKHSSME